jgi:hypothetical protein
VVALALALVLVASFWTNQVTGYHGEHIAPKISVTSKVIRSAEKISNDKGILDNSKLEAPDKDFEGLPEKGERIANKDSDHQKESRAIAPKRTSGNRDPTGRSAETIASKLD